MATRWNSSYLAWSRLIYLKGWIKILYNTLSSNTDLDSKKDAKRLKQIMISDHEWDLIADLTEVLSTFADATEDLGGSSYVTNSMCTPMLVEIIKTLGVESVNSSDGQANIDEQEEDVFENNDHEEQTHYDINEPVSTFGLLDKVKKILYRNMKKYYPTLITEPLISSILDPRFKNLHFASKDQQTDTKQHLSRLFEQEKEEYQKEIGTSALLKQSQPKSLAKKRKSLMERLSTNTKDSIAVLDELVGYHQLPEIPLHSDPLVWWNEKKEQFPVLARLARKYLAVSATSTASERLFSDAGNILTNKRTRMKPKLFKKIMFLKRNAANFDSGNHAK